MLSFLQAPTAFRHSFPRALKLLCGGASGGTSYSAPRLRKTSGGRREALCVLCHACPVCRQAGGRQD